MTHLSVVVPVYNESLLIEELVRRIKTNVELITEDFEIIIVDDGSQDETWALIENEGKNEKRIKGINFSRNFGHHYAITAGIHNSIGEWVVVMDGDLQDRPEVIPDLYKKAQSGFEVVFVSRQNRPEKIYYQIGQRLFYWILKIMSGVDFDSRQANFSIIHKKVADAFKKFPEHARFYGSTIKWLGFKRSFILADHGSRFAGLPSYTLRKRIKLAFDIIIAFSERPLKFAITLGLIMATTSIFSAAWIIYGTFKWGYSVMGWPSLISALFFSTGLILMFIGVLAIYLGEVFNQVKQRPLYLVSKSINLNSNAK
jgi:glycosyltransferase involved in cell wall biosynthesis